MGTWIVGTIVVLVIGLAAHSIFKDKRNGKSCGCDCGGCSGCPKE